MLSETQIARLAGMAASLRPDWPNASLYTFLARNHRDRAYRDVALALAFIACDPATTTPARMNEAGPWWTTTRDPNSAPTVRPITCPQCGQVHTKAEGCKRPEPAGDPAAHRETFRTLLAEARSGLCAQHHAKPCAECAAAKEDR